MIDVKMVINDQRKMTSDKSLCSVSVVLPCFNEERTIRENIIIISKYLADKFDGSEIIAVNDGSNDNTLSELRKAQKDSFIPLRIINSQKNRGKGAAVKSGVLKSKKGIVMFMDADLAIPIEELGKFLSEIEKGSDVVIASRFISRIKILKPVLWYRSIMEKVFRILRMIIINNYDVQDTQCGFKVFTRQATRKIFSRLTVRGWSFDVEIVFLAKKAGLKIKELPITLQNPQESHIRIVRDSWDMFWDLIRVRVNDWRGKYK